MTRELIATYQSDNSNYFEYDDGWAYQPKDDATEHPLEHAAYIADIRSFKIRQQVSREHISGEGIKELIDEAPSLQSCELGGRIVSIINQEGKAGIRRSGVIRDITTENKEDSGHSSIKLEP